MDAPALSLFHGAAGPVEVTALSPINDVVTTVAIERGIPIIDLQRVCGNPEDCSSIFPISLIKNRQATSLACSAFVMLLSSLDDFEKRAECVTHLLGFHT